METVVRQQKKEDETHFVAKAQNGGEKAEAYTQRV